MLVVHGSGLRPPPLQTKGFFVPPLLPGAVIDLDDDEQAFMDGILEETGAVFKGTGILNECHGAGFGDNRLNLPLGFLETHLDMTGFDLDEEDQQLLEQELFLGMMEALDSDDREQARLIGLLSDSGYVSAC
eukprot:CAMPEP_0172762922 /NCGR_PEP_ID=MMETSP1074-20121228/174403_1 /TAXON_ID=2916 /ORGANISM="Ceratium fusus, Strain PA161109" /LENGTH=131 /DNA_ID=CAMNT_0013597395 /DNA_START=27 /DNA_END=422 /DNA_ORIENTATION=-